MKYLLIIVVVWVIAWLWRMQRDRSAQEQAQAKPQRSPTVQKTEPMVGCAVCGLHLPAAEAWPGRGEQYFCCREHRDSAQA